jgi:hydroxymethylglutaryl-CoA reductase
MGLAGPLLVDGEHARGAFYVPLATTEGTLVASYNRGMKLAHAAGGCVPLWRRTSCSARRRLALIARGKPVPSGNG